MKNPAYPLAKQPFPASVYLPPLLRRCIAFGQWWGRFFVKTCVKIWK